VPAPSPPLTVKSADKSLTLNIPAGALPEGVKPSSIRITKMAGTDPSFPTVNNQAALACYILEPADLQLSSSANVTISLPFSSNNIPVPLLFSEIDGITLLDEIQSIPTQSGLSVTIKGKISLFSDLIISKQGPFTLTLINPGDELVGHSFEVQAVLTHNPELKNLVVKKKSNTSGEIVTYWLAFLSYQYNSYFSEQGTVSHMSPLEVSISGDETLLDTKSSVQNPITASFKGVVASNKVVLNCRSVISLKTECRSEKYAFQTRKNSVFIPETTCAFVIKKPWVSGKYMVHTSVVNDPTVYAPSISLALNITCTVTVNGSQITITGNGNWVTVKGLIQPDGTFSLTGKGMVGDNANTSVELVGAFTEYKVFEAKYIMGKTDVRVTYQVTGNGNASKSGVQVSNSPLFFSGDFQPFFESVGWIRANGVRVGG
jgi:hypothetical protein